jgi:predicted phosphodiesterase
MRINYFSDIHLEFGPAELPDTDADIIIAAGDIGIYDQGLQWLQALDKPIIYIAGNHEFYSKSYHATLSVLQKKSANTNIHFLENEVFVLNNVRFIGCSLWADLFIEGPEVADALAQSLNDFRKISFGDGKFTPEQFTALHKKSKVWLEAELAKPFAGKTVVVTHHAPTHWSWYDSPNRIKKLAYCNDLKEFFHEHEIAVWFHGHTHSIGDYRLAGARILSNTRGYVGRKEVTGFDMNKVVDI